MKEPCRSCPEKIKDYGGCRCQAYLMTGDPANADPVCDKSPFHGLVTDAIERARRVAAATEPAPDLLYRDDANSRLLAVSRKSPPA
jgi:pyrroloquinoline quinone biosynthesis protein E